MQDYRYFALLMSKVRPQLPKVLGRKTEAHKISLKLCADIFRIATHVINATYLCFSWRPSILWKKVHIKKNALKINVKANLS